MPFVGHNIIGVQLACPYCGKLVDRYQVKVSDFFTLCCQNKDCDSFMAEILIERRTSEIISVQAHTWRDAHGKLWKYAVKEVKDSIG